MKKNIVLFAALTIACTYAFADTYTYSVRRNPSYDQPSDSYYLDRKLQEQKEKSDPLSVGLLTRFGYAFNYDAFTYGVSFPCIDNCFHTFFKIKDYLFLQILYQTISKIKGIILINDYDVINDKKNHSQHYRYSQHTLYI